MFGFGKKVTPEAFKKACDKFYLYREFLIVDNEGKNSEEEETAVTDKQVVETLRTNGQKAITLQKEVQLPEGMDRATLNLNL